jgi:hypothetical protein
MSTERRQREGVAPNPEELDSLEMSLAQTLCECGDELGVGGCEIHWCPVLAKCRRLWRIEGKEKVERLNLTEYRRLDQKFALLKQERDCLMAKRE